MEKNKISQVVESCSKRSSRFSKNELKFTTQSHRMQKLNSGIGANSGDDDDDSESLSAIDDAEVFKYLNNKKEVHYKGIIWEVMNKDYQKGKNQKRAKIAKKADPTKEVVKPSRKINTEKRLSSKINYDMLKKLEHDEVHSMGKGEDLDSHRDLSGDTQLNNEKFNSKAYSSGENNNDEFEHENTCSEEADAIQDYCGITNYGIDDDGYNYDEEYDYGV